MESLASRRGTKLSISEVREKFKALGYTLLSQEYLGARSKLLVACPKGHEFSVLLYNFFGKSSRCPHCEGNARLTIEQVRTRFEARGYKLQSVEIGNAHDHLLVVCPSNHQWSVSINRFDKGQNCPTCLKLMREQEKEDNHQQSLALGIDITKFKLGNLCFKKHDWNNTGKSLVSVNAKNLRCRECVRLRSAENLRNNRDEINAKERAIYLNKRDEILANQKEYRRLNPDKVKLKKSREYQRNKEKIRIRGKLYREENIAVITAKKSAYFKSPQGKEVSRRAAYTRRARKAQNHLAPYTTDEILQRFADFNQICAYCEKRSATSLDHFISIKKQGGDCLGNLVAACRSCNSSKNDSDPFEWYKKQPTYSKKRWEKILKVLGKTHSNYTQLSLF